MTNVKFPKNGKKDFGPLFPKTTNDFISTVEISGDVEYLPKQLVKRIPNLRYVMLFEAVRSEELDSSFIDTGFELIEGLILHENDRPKTIKNGAFSKLQNLKFLTMSWSPIDVIEPEAFKANKYLRDIMFFKIEIKKLPENLFQGLEQLNSVDFIYSKIEEIPENLFISNQELKRVVFTSSNIQSISGNLFSQLPNLEVVGIDESHIKVLPGNLFANNPKLHFIGLHSNHIEKIPVETFSNLRKLEHVNLVGNKCVDKIYKRSEINALISDIKSSCA